MYKRQILYCVGLKLASVIACICNHSRSSSATRAPSSLKAHAFVGSGLNPQDSKDRRELLEGDDEGDRSSRENDVEPLLWQGSSLINSSNAIVLSSPRSHKWRMVEHMSVPDVDAAADSISSVESIAQTNNQARPSALFGLARFFFALAVF